MKLKIVSPNSRAGDVVFAVLAAVIGLLVRLPASLGALFPLNDGGLFYQMILDLQHNGFRLPEFSTYNTGNIPFAYPPFAFYLTGFLSSASHLDVITPAAHRAAGDQRAVRCGFLLPGAKRTGASTGDRDRCHSRFRADSRGFRMADHGRRITRSFGLLFALLTMRALYVMFSEHRARHMIAVVLCGSLTVLSHPEAAAQTALAAIILFLVLDRSRRGALYAAICGAGIALLSAPWWASVLLHHGISPFLAAAAAARAGTSVDLPARIFLTFRFQFTDESFLPLIAVVRAARPVCRAGQGPVPSTVVGDSTALLRTPLGAAIHGGTAGHARRHRAYGRAPAIFHVNCREDIALCVDRNTQLFRLPIRLFPAFGLPGADRHFEWLEPACTRAGSAHMGARPGARGESLRAVDRFRRAQ